MGERYVYPENPALVGKFATGATVTITIIRLLDNIVVAESAACAEINTTGYFKYSYVPGVSDFSEFLWTMTDGTNEVAGSFIIAGVSETPPVAGSEPADIIAAIEAFTPLSVQSYAEYVAGTNTTAKLLYNAGSRTQGNFSLFYAQALRTLTKDQAKYGLQLTTEEQPVALAYLIWDLGIKKFPDWDAKTVSPGGTESVTRNKPGVTSARAAYLDTLKGIKRSMATIPTIGDVDDYTNYPEDMHPCPIGHERISGDE